MQSKGVNSYWLLVIGYCLFMVSCKNDVKLAREEAQGLSEDFVQFYDKFHNDSAYQMAHIQFPLEGYPSGNMADSITDIASFRWTADKWVMHRPMEANDSLYSRQFEQPMPIMVNEVIIDKKTRYGMLRRFLKRDNDWFLIFYSDMNRMESRNNVDYSPQYKVDNTDKIEHVDKLKKKD